jgi:hypothetical protein
MKSPFEELHTRTEEENKAIREAYVKAFDDNLSDVFAIFTERSDKYDVATNPIDHFPFGSSSYLQLMWMKFLRIYSGLREYDKDVVESVDDSLIDLIAYTVMLRIYLNDVMPGTLLEDDDNDSEETGE